MNINTAIAPRTLTAILIATLVIGATIVYTFTDGAKYLALTFFQSNIENDLREARSPKNLENVYEITVNSADAKNKDLKIIINAKIQTDSSGAVVGRVLSATSPSRLLTETVERINEVYAKTAENEAVFCSGKNQISCASLKNEGAKMPYFKIIRPIDTTDKGNALSDETKDWSRSGIKEIAGATATCYTGTRDGNITVCVEKFHGRTILALVATPKGTLELKSATEITDGAAQAVNNLPPIVLGNAKCSGKTISAPVSQFFASSPLALKAQFTSSLAVFGATVSEPVQIITVAKSNDKLNITTGSDPKLLNVTISDNSNGKKIAELSCEN